MKKPTSRIFGFHHQYPQAFLDELAKSMGIKWTKVTFKTIPSHLVSVHPMGPPSSDLHYIDIKYNRNDE